MNRFRILAAATLVAAFGTQAQPAPGAASAAPSTIAAPTTDGEVRKVDKAQGKVTLKHGPIANLDMAGMTMAFKVADPKLLDDLKEGDKVRFSADRVNGAIAVTTIEVVR